MAQVISACIDLKAVKAGLGHSQGAAYVSFCNFFDLGDG